MLSLTRARAVAIKIPIHVADDIEVVQGRIEQDQIARADKVSRVKQIVEALVQDGQLERVARRSIREHIEIVVDVQVVD